MFAKCTPRNSPHLIIGLRVLAAASLFLSDPAVTPGISIGGASRRGWMAPASLSRYAMNSEKAWKHVKKWVKVRVGVGMWDCTKKGQNNFALVAR